MADNEYVIQSVINKSQNFEKSKKRTCRVQARGRLGEIVAPVVSRVALGNPEGDKNFALHFL